MRRYTSRLDNSTIDESSPEIASNRQLRHQGQLTETTYQDYDQQPSTGARIRQLSPDRSSRMRKGVLYDYFESKPLTRDVYGDQIPTETKPSTPVSFESRAKELEKNLPKLYPKKGRISFEDTLSVDSKPEQNGDYNKIQPEPIKQIMIGSADSIDKSTNGDKVPSEQITNSRHSLNSGSKKRPSTGLISVDEDAMQYLRETKKKTVIDPDDLDIESLQSRRYSSQKLDPNATLRDRLRHEWKILSDVKGGFFVHL